MPKGPSDEPRDWNEVLRTAVIPLRQRIQRTPSIDPVAALDALLSKSPQAAVEDLLAEAAGPKPSRPARPVRRKRA